MDSLNGKMLLYAIVSALVAAPVAAALLFIFKRSVIRGMRQHGVGGVAPVLGTPPPAESTRSSQPTLAEADRSVLGAFGVYAVAGLAVAAVFTGVYGVQLGEFNPLALVFEFPRYTVPILFCAWIVLPKGPGRLVLVALGFGIGAMMVLVPYVLAGTASVIELLFVLTVPAVPAAILIGLFMTRRVRAAGPLVLAIVAGSVVGWNAIFDAAEASPAVYDFLLWLQSLVGGGLVLVAIVAFGSFFGVLAAWPLLRAVGLLHRHKVLSDQSLALDIVFLWFCAFFGLEAAAEGPVWALTGLAAFGVYKAVTLVGFGLLAISRSAQPRADILLLRPFALGRRSERLFDHLSKVWLRVGAVHMIAGPDLVMATVAPPEFLVFLSGGLSRRFIHDGTELHEHLLQLDLDPDPDGRHRVNQLFCRDNVWREAMQALAARSSAVLMDLRGFASTNQGCCYEIAELIRGVPLRRVVFAVDDTTDRSLLQAVSAEVIRTLPVDSPNRGVSDIASRVISVDNSARGRRELLDALMKSTAV